MRDSGHVVVCTFVKRRFNAQLQEAQVGHVKTGSCTAELWLISITTEMRRRITGTVRDLP